MLALSLVALRHVDVPTHCANTGSQPMTSRKFHQRLHPNAKEGHLERDLELRGLMIGFPGVETILEGNHAIGTQSIVEQRRRGPILGIALKSE